MMTATQIRARDVLVLDGELYTVLKVDHITPGKGNAVVQTDLRNVATGLKTNRRFRSVETVERAQLSNRDMQYLYKDGNDCVFMDSETFDQVHLPADVIGDRAYYLKENTPVNVTFYDERPIGLELPQKMVFEIVECDPHMKTATKSASNKPAKLDNGLTIKVPSFLEVGQKVLVDTTTNEYIERA